MSGRGLVLLTAVLCCTAGPVRGEDLLAGAEQQAMADTLQYALEHSRTDEVADWVNPDTAHSGAVIPTRTFDGPQGQPCREFLTTIIIGDREEQGYGTACRQPDGSWQLVDDDRQLVPPVRTRVYATAPPPPVYYGYPTGFYGPNRIFLSFNYVSRSGHLHYGVRYLDGPSFRHRHPFKVRERVYLGPQIFYRYRLHDEWRYREWERHRRSHDDDDRGRDRYDGDRGKKRSKGRDDDRRSDDRDRRRDRYDDDRHKERSKGWDDDRDRRR